MNNGGGVKKPKKPKMQTGGGVPKMPMSMLKKRHPMQKGGDAKKPKMQNGGGVKKPKMNRGGGVGGGRSNPNSVKMPMNGKRSKMQNGGGAGSSKSDLDKARAALNMSKGQRGRDISDADIRRMIKAIKS